MQAGTKTRGVRELRAAGLRANEWRKSTYNGCWFGVSEIKWLNLSSLSGERSRLEGAGEQESPVASPVYLP